MDKDMIDASEAAVILGVTTRRAARTIIAGAGLSIQHGKYGVIYVPRHEVEALAARRKAMGMTSRRGWVPGRPRKSPLATGR